MKILFQGDSVTDAGRGADGREMGNGYPKYAVEKLRQLVPAAELEFVNLGISGNRVRDLLGRLQSDFIDIQPDVVTILIGINDTWRAFDSADPISCEAFEQQYEELLQAVQTQTHAKIVMLEPFLVDVPDKPYRADLDPKIDAVRRLARKYAVRYVASDGFFAEECLRHDPLALAADGVHPTPLGARLLGERLADVLADLIENG